MIINALPSSLKMLTSRIEKAISSWPIDITMDHAIRWILQFDSDDYLLAVRLIEHLDVLGSAQVRSALEVANTKLMRRASEKGAPIKGDNTLYAGIGSSAKSGSLISYHYRVTAELSEDDFLSGESEEELDLKKIENIVLVDDVIGTGKTVAKEVIRVAEEIYALSQSRNIFVLTVAGYLDGIHHVIEETGASVVSALEYSTLDTVSVSDAAFYEGLQVAERTAVQQRIKRYCKSISTSDLGFGGVGGLLVFDHNTPNTTLPIIWHTGKGWRPLFPRAVRIPGAAKVLKSAKNEAKTTNQKPNIVVDRGNVELTLFMEGKVDEIFIDLMRQKKDLAGRIGVREVAAVALGGLHGSDRLVDLLRESRKHAVFIFEDDRFTRARMEHLRDVDKVPVLTLKPNFISLLDIERIYAQRDRFPRLPELPESSELLPDLKWLTEVERALIRRPITANTEGVMQLIDEFLDPHKYDKFIEELRAVVDQVFNK